MSKYRIFTESKKFVITNNVVFYGVFGFILLLYLIHKYIFNWFFISEINFGYLFILPLLISLYFLLFRVWTTHEPLKGTLDTYLELYNDHVMINDQKYFLNDISSIEILNYDFVGEFNYAGRGNFNGQLSNGIGNLFRLNLNSGENIEVNFQQDKEHKIANDKNELVCYYKDEKISLKNFAKILGYKENDKNILEAIIQYNS